jgi:hypothetical protein
MKSYTYRDTSPILTAKINGVSVIVFKIKRWSRRYPNMVDKFYTVATKEPERAQAVIGGYYDIKLQNLPGAMSKFRKMINLISNNLITVKS